MGVRVLHVLALLLAVWQLMMVMVVSHDALPQERYWNAILPGTRMPKSVVDLLNPDFMDDKSTNVNVGKGGVHVDTRHGKHGGDTFVDVGQGAVHVDTGKANPGRRTHVSVGNNGHGGGVGVHTGKPGKGTDVGVGKGGVSVHTRHKGKPVFVGVKPDPTPFLYQYAASKTQLYDDPNVALFFKENDLRPGRDITVRFCTTDDGYNGKTVFLPREEAEKMPFGLNNFPEILNRFDVKPGSDEAEVMKETIEECEERGISGEKKYCATSLESMLDFSVFMLGKDHIQALSTEVQNKDGPKQKYIILDAGVKKVSGGKSSVVCHKQKYPHAVFYCHKIRATRLYVVQLEGEDGTRVKAVAVCHTDTSDWNPNHLAFKVLHIRPGSTVPVCHFLPADNVVWFKN